MAQALDLSLDRGSEVPLGTQLVWKLRMLMAAGTLAPGTRLPGVRETAEAAGVNVNTVRSVFARLEDQGLLASEQGRGTFVAGSVRPDTPLAQLAAAATADARAAGIDPRELAAILYATPRAPASGQPGRKPAAPDSGERDQRRGLRAEIARLEQQLTKLEPLAPLNDSRAVPAGRILTTAELRGVRDVLAERVESLRLDRQQDRAAAERERMEDTEPSPVRPARWRNSGIWTGRRSTGVSWTAS